MSSLQSVILTLSVSYALIGALLLVVLVYARLPWSAKAVAVIVTSAFYIASFVGMRGLLGWASVDRLPADFKLLQARIVEPHSLEGDPGSIYLWVEALDEDNRPSGVPEGLSASLQRQLAEKTDKAPSEIAAGRPQGGRAADFGSGEGGLIDAVARVHYAECRHGDVGRRSLDRRWIEAPPAAGDGVSFTPLLPPRMPPKESERISGRFGEGPRAGHGWPPAKQPYTLKSQNID